MHKARISKPDMSNRAADLSQRVVELADQCVKCGLCVPVCPTYRVARTEAESPRGRIAFAAALAGGAVEPSPSLRDHLDRCLACMTCERVCPSHVKYSELIVDTRQLLRDKTNTRGFGLISHLVRHPIWLGIGLRITDSALVRTLLKSRIVNEAPRIPPKVKFRTTRATPTRGRVGLFIGCVAATADRDVHAAATRVLEALGYDVVVPAGQACCGALDLHAGDIARSEQTGASTRVAFEASGVDTVLVSASGCFGTLRDRTLAGTNVRVRDIHEFIAGDANFGQLRFSPLRKTAALHTPCTQANVAKSGGSVAHVLAAIPDLKIVALPTEPGCCGAAGDYFLRHPAVADALRAEKLDQIGSIDPDLLITSNVGCRSFLDTGLRRRSKHVRVTHPVVLLAQQLEN